MLHQRKSEFERERETVLGYGICHGDGWEGVCLDFNISVQGASFQEVRALLIDAVHSYIEDARAELPDVRDRLLSRRSPLLVRAKIAARLALQTLGERYEKRRDLATSFPVPCHA